MTIDWVVEWHGRVTSTMDLARARAESGDANGLVIVADEQTAGRGRYDRVWQAPYGAGLLMTVVLSPGPDPARLPELSVRVAELLGQAISNCTGVNPRVKPPNDLMIGDRKLAGVLCQSRSTGSMTNYVLIGCGINVNLTADARPVEHATSLSIETGRDWDRSVLMEAILDELAGLQR